MSVGVYSILTSAQRHLREAVTQMAAVADKLDPDTIDTMKKILRDVGEAKQAAWESLRARAAASQTERRGKKNGMGN